MAVNVTIYDHAGEQIGHNPAYVCFGFLNSVGGTQRALRIETTEEASLLHRIKTLKYIPNPLKPEQSPKIALKYLELLHNIGISTALQYSSKVLDLSVFEEGVTVDLTVVSGQEAVGAMELVRNITYHWDFVKKVVSMCERGIPAEIALFVPRFFNSAGSPMFPPGADTTSYLVGDRFTGDHRLFSIDRRTMHKKSYPAWTKSPEYAGVYKFYGKKARCMPMSSKTYRAGYSVEPPLGNTYETDSLIFNVHRTPMAQLTNNELYSLCKFYEKEGTFQWEV